MTKTNIKSNRIVEGLGAYITELDSLRPPSRFGVSSQSFVVTMELLFKQPQKSYFFRNNRELKKKVSRKMHDFRTDTKVDSKEMIMTLIPFLIGVFFIITSTTIITDIYSLSIGQSSLILIGISILILYFFFSFAIMNRRKVLGERHDEDLKRSVQSLIDFGVELCNDNNLNPDIFPIKLRHDDYDGLIYKKKGQNNYVGYLKK
ncbi:MAG: hypothetical protein QM396_07105 [Euryarchaeota archaeon]|jgi:hypothetical protein|uniref:hypothetical protein n=1 Tax=Methanobacterium sp. MZD130B TaxID=3394378 RepID=UPI00375D1706|nr:hypothetical protein [Methanobacterium sp.]MDI9435759.1 hypothetical protein [Euryarchaeota archaeon]